MNCFNVEILDEILDYIIRKYQLCKVLKNVPFSLKNISNIRYLYIQYQKYTKFMTTQMLEFTCMTVIWLTSTKLTINIYSLYTQIKYNKLEIDEIS